MINFDLRKEKNIVIYRKVTFTITKFTNQIVITCNKSLAKHVIMLGSGMTGQEKRKHVKEAIKDWF